MFFSHWAFKRYWLLIFGCCVCYGPEILVLFLIANSVFFHFKIWNIVHLPFTLILPPDRELFLFWTSSPLCISLHISIWPYVGRICKTAYQLTLRSHSESAWPCFLFRHFSPALLQFVGRGGRECFVEMARGWSHILSDAPVSCFIRLLLSVRNGISVKQSVGSMFISRICFYWSSKTAQTVHNFHFIWYIKTICCLLASLLYKEKKNNLSINLDQ